MSSYWFGQEQELMSHEVPSHGYVGFGVNATMDDMSSYRTNITLEYCENLYANETERLLKMQPNGFCNVSFDNILCWPPTPLNTTTKVKCFSEFLGIRYDDTQNASRFCSWNGSWTKSKYDDCTELDPFSSNVETQINIYLIGYVISSVTLALALFIFTYFKELRCLRNIIHMNLMWSYLLTYCMWIIILIEMNFRDHMAVTCVFVVTLLHYFHLTTFFWMFVEGLYLYILVVRTLTRESFKLRVYALIGWGTPLFFVILWASIKSFLIQRISGDPTDACSWFRGSDIDYVFQVPTILVLLVNIIFMISIMIVLVTKLRSANTLEIQQYRKAVKALAVLIPLLGVTYAITIYAPSGILDMFRSALLSVQEADLEEHNIDEHHNDEDDEFVPPIGSEQSDSDQSDDARPKKRKRLATKEEWSDNKNKKLRQQGKAYIGWSRPKNKLAKRGIRKEERKMELRCESRLCLKSKTRKCYAISEEDRQKLFRQFWSDMTWDQKKIYVSSLVSKSHTARSTKASGETRDAQEL